MQVKAMDPLKLFLQLNEAQHFWTKIKANKPTKPK